MYTWNIDQLSTCSCYWIKCLQPHEFLYVISWPLKFKTFVTDLQNVTLTTSSRKRNYSQHCSKHIKTLASWSQNKFTKIFIFIFTQLKNQYSGTLGLLYLYETFSVFQSFIMESNLIRRSSQGATTAPCPFGVLTLCSCPSCFEPAG